MTQNERLDFLLHYLIKERKEYENIRVPDSHSEKQRYLRSLMNVRPPLPVSAEFLSVQDAYLSERLVERGVTRFQDLTPVQPGLYLWRGDITTLAADTIVNAANSGMLGCFVPCHGCIDNAIHSAAGLQLRDACAEIMRAQGHPEPAGRAKLTRAYNLPARYVLHTVGPIVGRWVTWKDRRELAACYRSCLALAAEHDLRSVVFCCISTGEFHFPNQEAAEIAVRTVREFLEQQTTSVERVIFNVFKDLDAAIYRRLLGPD